MQFVIFEDSDEVPIEAIYLNDRILDSMIREGTFELARIRFQIKNKIVPTQIVLKFGTIAMHPISGFPRYLLAGEEQPGSTKQPTSLSSTASTRYTHGSRRLMRSTETWKAPDFKTTPKLSNLDLYADRERALGDDGAEPENISQTRETTLNLAPGRNASDVSVSRKKNGVREAFRALWWPSKSGKSGDDELYDSKRPAELPEDLQQWLSAYRQVQENIHQHVAGVPDGQLAFSLQYYNVKPEEYAVYLQWVNLLQPTGTAAKVPWLPPVAPQAAEFAQSAQPGQYSEMPADNNFAAELSGYSSPRGEISKDLSYHIAELE